MKHVYTNEKGYTLAELILVLTVVGILAGVVISLINRTSVNRQADDAIRLQNLSSLAEAIEIYNELEGEYPDTCEKVWSDGFITDVAICDPGGGGVDGIDYTFSGGNVNIYIQSYKGNYFRYTTTEGKTMECPTPTSPISQCTFLSRK